MTIKLGEFDLHKEYEEVRHMQPYYFPGEPMPSWIQFVQDFIESIVRADRCKHWTWEDHSYGGPDSGAMAGECKDCGFSYHHQLY